MKEGSSLLIITSLLLISACLSLIGSGYSLGRNENDKDSGVYKGAIAFIVIGIILVIVIMWLMKMLNDC